MYDMAQTVEIPNEHNSLDFIPHEKLVSILKGVCDLISEGITIVDHDLNIVWLNKALESKGFLLKNVIGHKTYEVFDNQSRPDPDSAALKTFRNSEVNTRVKEGRDGLKYKITAMPIKDKTGNVIYAIEYSEVIPIQIKELSDIKAEHDLLSITKFDRTVLIRTKSMSYFQDCIDLLTYLIKEKNMDVLVITFEPNIRDLMLTLDYKKKINIDKIRIIDAVSIASGRGTPPVQHLITLYRPNNFNDIEIYSNLILKGLDYDNVGVVLLSLHHLGQYEDWNEIGMFLKVYTDLMNRFKVPQFIIVPKSDELSINRMMDNYADKIILLDF